MRIVILGTGFVSAAYARALIYLGYHPLILSRSWFSYERHEIDYVLRSYQPDVVINGVGDGGATTVDDCESEAGRALAFRANVTFARVAREAAESVGATLIQVSTGCMFTGPGPFVEDDEANNLRPYYVGTKLEGEAEAARYAKAFIFRIRMPFNHTWSPRNLLVKLCRHERILDGRNSLTFIDEFCARSWAITQKGPRGGIYHAAYPTPVRTMEVAQMLFDAGLRTLPVVPYPPEEFLSDGHVPRSEAVLSSQKFEEAYGTPFGDPYCAIRWCIDRMVESRQCLGTCDKTSTILGTARKT